MKFVLAAAFAATLTASSAMAQPPSDATAQMAPQPGDAGPGGPNSSGPGPRSGPVEPHGDVPVNEGPYAGASPKGFYDVGQRIDRLQAALAGTPHARQGVAQLNAIRSDLQYRMKRHDGVLRDYDRELITQKLDVFVAKHPALKR